ncbi:hypothetical protein DRN69_04180 [Candidatus Pacearchaeota archaeon]|nr:MAG: hypothetical protein DRN69_04180 [Candidatus Pacearchaeota archaeon]
MLKIPVDRPNKMVIKKIVNEINSTLGINTVIDERTIPNAEREEAVVILSIFFISTSSFFSTINLLFVELILLLDCTTITFIMKKWTFLVCF